MAAGADSVYGGAGNDVIDGGDGGDGGDWLEGGAGDDHYAFGLNDSAVDTVFDHSGANRISLAVRPGGDVTAGVVQGDLHVKIDGADRLVVHEYTGHEANLAGIDIGGGLRPVSSFLAHPAGPQAGGGDVLGLHHTTAATSPDLLARSHGDVAVAKSAPHAVVAAAVAGPNLFELSASGLHDDLAHHDHLAQMRHASAHHGAERTWSTESVLARSAEATGLAQRGVEMGVTVVQGGVGRGQLAIGKVRLAAGHDRWRTAEGRSAARPQATAPRIAAPRAGPSSPRSRASGTWSCAANSLRQIGLRAPPPTMVNLSKATPSDCMRTRQSRKAKPTPSTTARARWPRR